MIMLNSYYIALCSIVQDSEEDWAEEAACMDKVYQGGICNLAACDTSDSNGSLFSSRQPLVGGAIVHQQTFADSSSVFTLIPDWVKTIWNECSLYKRGWVMQERWLSPRIIHFSQFPIWECSSGLVSEVFPPRVDDAWDPQEMELCFPKSQRGWLFDHDDMIDILYRWWQIIHLYSKCSLSYNSDRLVAISGMARAYSVLANEPYYAGIWGGKYFLCSLLWSAIYEYDEAPIPNLRYLGAPKKNLCHFVSQRTC